MRRGVQGPHCLINGEGPLEVAANVQRVAAAAALPGLGGRPWASLPGAGPSASCMPVMAPPPHTLSARNDILFLAHQEQTCHNMRGQKLIMNKAGGVTVACE